MKRFQIGIKDFNEEFDQQLQTLKKIRIQQMKYRDS